MALLTCQDLSLSYEGNTVLSSLDMSVQAGDYLCIVGENGSGKSTLIKAMLTLKTPTKGDIFLGDGLIHREIGYLPQQTNLQRDFPASVWEVVLSGCLNTRKRTLFFSAKDKRKAIENLKKLGVAELKRNCFRELSGGQRQRVLLARALCATSKMLIVDEPTAGLDPLASFELYRIIQKINQEGITIIMVSHDVLTAVKYASHILHLENKPLFFDTTHDYLSSDIGKLFLGGKTIV